MGYVEKILGDNEQVLYRTHLHAIVLLQRIVGALFAFAVFLALGLAVLLPPADRSGDQVRFWIGVIALCTLILPAYLLISAWIRGKRGREFLAAVWRPILLGVLILIVAVVMMAKPGLKPLGWIAVAIAIVPLFELIRVVFDWLNERYLITNRRVMEVRGIVNKHIRDSALEKVNDVDMKQSVVGRILGYGTVQIITGSDIGVNMFHRISNPVRFKREMLNAKELLHTTAPAIAAEGEAFVAPSLPHAEAKISDLLKELDELRQKGIISEEEFQAKKKELLERL
jgi:uncharacterized membrane protein YdbT with pleckstrin-like domain